MDHLRQAQHFLEHEQQFHLGFLPTEQSSPLTRSLDRIFAASAADGVRKLQQVDENVLVAARRIFADDAYRSLVAAGTAALRGGHKLVFSGCGATGRLSILLEAMWRRHFLDHPGQPAELYGHAVFSIMTGGDYALIRSVEFFEDYQEFGRQQVRELGMAKDDVLVAITEGGETSSVLGSVDEAARRGALVFLMFNNPAELLREKLARCRQAIAHPAVTVLDLSCGPMAIAGSTRMQATTCELLVAGAALEDILRQLTDEPRPTTDFAATFEALLAQIGAPEAVAAIAEHLEFEAELYGAGGLVTYFADDFLLDIFTDTTERSPTFMLPPFRKGDDQASPQSWAFVKNPLLPTPEAWQRCLARPPRCLAWSGDDYRRLGAPEWITAAPPKLDQGELMRFIIGNEDLPERHRGIPNAAILIGDGEPMHAAFAQHAAPYRQRRHLRMPFRPAPSPLRLMNRLGVKLLMNTISTGTMVRMGRISGNWMSWVDVSNKKLLDRGVRLLVELCHLSYPDACRELFQSIAELEAAPPGGGARISPVQHALRRLEPKPQAGHVHGRGRTTAVPLK